MSGFNPTGSARTFIFRQKMSWELLLFTVAATQGVLLSIAFMTDLKNSKKIFLGSYLLCFSLTILFYVAFWMKYIDDMPVLLKWIGSSVSWLIPPFLLLFIQDKKPSRLIFLAHTGLFILYSLYFWMNVLKQLSVPGGMIGLIAMVQLLGYGYVAERESRGSRVERLMFWGYISYVVGMAIYYLLVLTGTYRLTWDYMICSAFVLIIYGITYLSQRTFLTRWLKASYSSSSLTREEGELLYARIRNYLDQGHAYRDAGFNLSMLARGVNVPKYRVSQCLNQYCNTSFSEFINGYRVRDAREKLLSQRYRHLKVEAIGVASGFRNKVSFYHYFKKAYGSSPGEYRDRQQEQPSRK